MKIFLLDDNHGDSAVIKSFGMVIVAPDEANARRMAREHAPDRLEGMDLPHIWDDSGGAGSCFLIGEADPRLQQGVLFSGTLEPSARYLVKAVR